MRPGVHSLSVVVVVHREQAHLERFAASVLDQEGVDVELVAVDDASPDHGPALLDALAERDPRVRVRHLAQRAGPGPARNLALDLAEGDAVWFARATDELAPGSLAAASERLRATDADVLVVGHVRVDVLGARTAGAGPGREALRRIARDDAATLAAHPELAATAPRLWDKVLRAAHLRDLRARFGPGAHSALTVTWPALARARRIAALPATSYLRHELPGAVAEPGSPLDVFAQYDAVLAALPPGGERELALRAMREHELSLLASVAEPERREFFARIADAQRRHGGRAADPSGAVERLRRALVARGDYAAYQGLEASLGAWRAARRGGERLHARRRSLVATAQRVSLERHYRERLRRPVDPDLAVFAAYWYRGCVCNPRAIHEAARELVPGLRAVWVVGRRGADAMPGGVEHVIAGTPEYYDAIARAGTLVNNVNFPNHLVKREGSVHVMTHHGTPLKRMGLDLRDTPGRDGGMDFAALLRRCARWDYSVSQNAFSTLVWERVYPGSYESLEAGYPRNDVLVRATGEDVARVRAHLGIAPGRRAVLYAPTRRDHLDGYVAPLDVGAVAARLGPDVVVLARPHYSYGPDRALRELHRAGRVLDVAAHESVEELCLAADVLITDYSSIMFDYAVLDRPIVVHAPDWELYRAVRGTYFDLLAEPPGVVTRTEEEVVRAFASGAVWGAEADAARRAFRARFCALEDGHASERVVRRAWGLGA
jgi:CDP-glycerol glycerophosphotransferase